MSIGYELKIKNFGPISAGFSNPANDDFFLISKCTVFIGEQGTGKSTVAKIASTFLWLEKDFIQKQTDYNNFSAKDFIQLCKNQKIHLLRSLRMFSKWHQHYWLMICSHEANFKRTTLRMESPNLVLLSTLTSVMPWAQS